MRTTRTAARTWQSNADEARELDGGEGWVFARLVACSVEKGERGGDTSIAHARNGKTSALEFAARWGTTHDRVLRFLAGWTKAAELGLVADPATLTPADVDTPYPATPEHSWTKPGGGYRYVTAKNLGEASPEQRAAVEREATSAGVSANTVVQVINTPAAVAAAIKADPRIAGEASRALHEVQQRTDLRTERVANADPVGRRIDSAVAIEDIMAAARKFADSVAVAQRHVGTVSDGQRPWLVNANERARAAVQAIDHMIETGTTSIEAELAELLSGGAS